MTSREVLHELYYVSMEEGVSLDAYIVRVAALSSIRNLTYLDTTFDIDPTDVTFDKVTGLRRIDPRGL